MSFGNFILHGLQDQQKHLRGVFQKDTIESVASNGVFEGKTVVLEGDDESVKKIMIDGVAMVSTIADQVRNEQLRFWKTLRTKSFVVFTGTLVAGLAMAGGAIALSLTLWPVAIAVGCVALPVLGFSFCILYRGIQAGKQKHLWKDPLPKYVRQRQTAGREGFDYVFEKKLRGSLVSSEETQNLWKSKVEAYDQKFSNLSEKPVHAVHEFMGTRIFGKEKTDYAFGNGVLPQHIETAKASFEKLNGTYVKVTDRIKILQKELENTREVLYDSSRNQRDCQLQPWKSWLATTRLPILAQRHGIICSIQRARGKNSPCDHHRIALLNSELRDCDWKMSQLEMTYTIITRPIHALHARNVCTIDHWYLREAKRLKKQKSHLDSFVRPISTILEDYKLGKEVPSAGVNLDVSFFNHFHLTPPPLLERGYTPSPYRSAWALFFTPTAYLGLYL